MAKKRKPASKGTTQNRPPTTASDDESYDKDPQGKDPAQKAKKAPPPSLLDSLGDLFFMTGNLLGVIAGVFLWQFLVNSTHGVATPPMVSPVIPDIAPLEQTAPAMVEREPPASRPARCKGLRVHHMDDVDSYWAPRVIRKAGISMEHCNQLIQLSEETGGHFYKGPYKSLQRIVFLDKEMPAVRSAMETAIAFAVKHNKEYWKFSLPTNVDSGLVSQPEIRVYNASEKGVLDWHLALQEKGIHSRRRIGIFIQLSNPDDYEGGLWEIRGGAKPANVGRMQGLVAAHPEYMLQHIHPVTRGKLYTMVFHLSTNHPLWAQDGISTELNS